MVYTPRFVMVSLWMRRRQQVEASGRYFICTLAYYKSIFRYCLPQLGLRKKLPILYSKITWTVLVDGRCQPLLCGELASDFHFTGSYPISYALGVSINSTIFIISSCCTFAASLDNILLFTMTNREWYCWNGSFNQFRNLSLGFAPFADRSLKISPNRIKYMAEHKYWHHQNDRVTEQTIQTALRDQLWGGDTCMKCTTHTHTESDPPQLKTIADDAMKHLYSR